MKLLYLAFVRLPTEKAHGLQIIKTCEALANQGVEVELVVPGRRTTVGGGPFEYYGAKKNFVLTELGTPDWVQFGLLGFLASLVWFSEAAKWQKNFWSADVIYSRDALGLLQYVLLGRAMFYEAHQKPTFLSLLAARLARRVMVISNNLKDAYVSAGIAESKITVASDAVDERMFANAPSRDEARRLLGFHQEDTIVLYAGRLSRKKGAHTLAEAAAAIPDAVFLFAGSGSDDFAYWGNAHVRVLGYIAHELIPIYLRSANLLVIPNSGKDDDPARFGSPMKLFEYMASGTPIVATRVPAITSILPPDAAFFADPDDAISLAAIIRDALGDPDATLRAERALELSKKYSWRNRAETILQSLKKALG